VLKATGLCLLFFAAFYVPLLRRKYASASS